MLSWMIAGGVLAGGFLVVYGTRMQHINERSLLYTAGGFYIFGSAIGAILGGALGMFGRPIEESSRRAFRDQLLALLYVLPVLFLAFVLTGWIAMSIVAIHLGKVLPLVGVSIAYVIGLATIAVALRFGWFGTRDAWERLSRDIERLGKRFPRGESEEQESGDN